MLYFWGCLSFSLLILFLHLNPPSILQLLFFSTIVGQLIWVLKFYMMEITNIWTKFPIRTSFGFFWLVMTLDCFTNFFFKHKQVNQIWCRDWSTSYQPSPIHLLELWDACCFLMLGHEESIYMLQIFLSVRFGFSISNN